MVSRSLISGVFRGGAGENMASGRIEREWLDAQHGSKLQGAVEVREKRAAARGFPFQPLAEHGGVYADQQKIALTREILCRCRSHLFGGREMYEAIAAVDRGACVDAGALGIVPFGSRANFVDHCHCIS